MLIETTTLKKNSTSQIIELYVQDTSGNGVTGLTYTSFTKLYAYGIGGSGSKVDGTPNGAQTLNTYSSKKLVEVDSTNIPGVYQYSAPDGFWSINSPTISIVAVVTGQPDIKINVFLSAVNLNDGVKNSSDGWDAIAIESYNPRIALTALMAIMGGELIGADTNTITAKAWRSPATTRLTCTTDSSGNRSSFTWTLPS